MEGGDWITQHFSLAELTRSATAKARHINNDPPEFVGDNLRRLAIRLLEPIRTAVGGAVTVTSGYRCPRLNAAVGGVDNSQHTLGEAADITLGSAAVNRRFFEDVKNGVVRLYFDQIILEPAAGWLHVSFKRDGNRMQLLDYSGRVNRFLPQGSGA